MADKKEIELNEPELAHDPDSEIQAIVDVSAVGNDGIFRPIMINQSDEEFLTLTVEDAERLAYFLVDALEFLVKHKNRTLQ